MVNMPDIMAFNLKARPVVETFKRVLGGRWEGVAKSNSVLFSGDHLPHADKMKSVLTKLGVPCSQQGTKISVGFEAALGLVERDDFISTAHAAKKASGLGGWKLF